jgi:membrane fusion protein (multidrug efflux system)
MEAGKELEEIVEIEREPLPRSGISKGMRYLAVFAGLAVLIGALVGIKYKQISQLMAMGKTMQAAGPPPESVSTAVSKEDTWQGMLNTVGNVTAAKGVTLSNDAPGLVTGIYFESGDVVKQGQLLVQLDSNVERAQLGSAQARKELALLNAGRTRALVASAAIAKSQQDTDDSAVRSSRSDLDALEAQIARKMVRAPFSGRLGIRQVNLGQYLGSGTAIAVLESTSTVFVDFTLPQQRVTNVAIGMPVHLRIEEANRLEADGKISAIDPSVDTMTRSLRIRASLPNDDGKLLPGMFATVTVLLPETHPVVTVPSTAIVHAPYGDSLFVVEQKKDEGGNVVKGPDGNPALVARQQFVKVGDARGDFVAVDKGINAGDTIVSAGAFKLRNGAGIVVHNDVQPKPELDPHPDNR